jgi:HAD superfamily hydrolase (TIGR01509 family)
MMIKGVFFDMDGTIADSEKIVWKVTRDFMAKRGIFLTLEEEKLLYGLTWKHSVRKIYESRGMAYNQNTKDTLKERYVRTLRKEAVAMPHIYGLLEQVKKNFKVGLATNSRIREVDIIFEKLDFNKYFDIRLARNHIKNVKPDPEIYLKGASIFGFSPQECVVFEDSIVGITAAKGAGMKCIAIVNTYSVKELGIADIVINDYREITIDKIKELGK